MLRFSGAGVSDIGRVREHNEDSAFVAPYLALVADGVGGAAAGEVASATATYVVSATALARFGGRLETILRDAVSAVRLSLRAGVHDDDDSRAGMATTLTAVVTDGRRVLLGHVGDSRAYTYRSGRLEQVSRDHTQVQLQASTDSDLEDLELVELEMAPGDRIMLCSDGLSDLVDEERMAEVLTLRDPHSATAASSARCRTSPTWWTPGSSAAADPLSARRTSHPRATQPCQTSRMSNVKRPALEGTVAVRDDRRLSFAEFGIPRGPAIVWMHGTPGSRRQIPLEARAFAQKAGLRIIGIDRPGIGSSTPHLYPNILDWTRDLEILLDTLAVDTVRMVGLSGGGPYALAAGVGLPDRVHGIGVLGGVAPTQGADAADGGIIQLAVRLAPLLTIGRVPLGIALTQAIRLVRPLAGPGLDLYAAVQPPGDKNLLSRPEFKAMFLDDLLNGSRFQISAPINDLVLFTRHWGFDPADVSVPVRWWHGGDDHIVPFRHGQHVVDRLPDATMTVIDGESHLGGLGIAEQVIRTLMDLGPRRASGSRTARS